jgi:hypothetical protein
MATTRPPARSTVASPTTALSHGISASVTWKASARAWLVPSAARNRSKASASSFQGPAARAAPTVAAPPASPCSSGTGAAPPLEVFGRCPAGRRPSSAVEATVRGAAAAWAPGDRQDDGVLDGQHPDDGHRGAGQHVADMVHAPVHPGARNQHEHHHGEPGEQPAQRRPGATPEGRDGHQRSSEYLSAGGDASVPTASYGTCTEP